MELCYNKIPLNCIPTLGRVSCSCIYIIFTNNIIIEDFKNTVSREVIDEKVFENRCISITLNTINAVWKARSCNTKKKTTQLSLIQNLQS